MVLQMLLREAGADVDQGLVHLEPDGIEAAADWDNLRHGRTYVGHERAVGFASPGGIVPDQRHSYWHRPNCGATSGHCPVSGGRRSCRRGSTNRAVPSRSSSTLAICTS